MYPNKNSQEHSNQSKTDSNFYELLTSSIDYPKWMGKFYSIMTAFYGSNWTDKFKNHDVGKILIRSWYLALKAFPEEIIMNSLPEHHHQYEFAPSSPVALVELMRNNYRHKKEDQETKRLQANVTTKLLGNRSHETKTAEEFAHHGRSMADLDKMRGMMGLPPFDENKLKTGESALNDKTQHYLNIMSKVDILLHTQ